MFVPGSRVGATVRRRAIGGRPGDREVVDAERASTLTVGRAARHEHDVDPVDAEPLVAGVERAGGRGRRRPVASLVAAQLVVDRSSA